jgi:uncharacterized Fe-S center protein
MKSKVYFTNLQTKPGKNLLDKLEELYEKAGFDKIIEKDKFVAVKIHIGEPGNLAFVSPLYVRRIEDKIKERGGKPFITDANTLYVGKRGNAVDHIESAIKNGFSYDVVGAPFIVADGLKGYEYVEVEIDGVHFKKAKIAPVIAQADALIALSHFKGHMGCGFGGSCKNVGMGSASRAGKQMQHSDLKPKINQDKCKVCLTCLKNCPAKAIILIEKKVNIDQNKCIGCGECIVICPHQAIPIIWQEGKEGSLQEKIAEYTLAVMKTKEKRCGFINFLINITPDCDCLNRNEPPITPDIGILASFDPIAIDKASVDIINRVRGNIFSKLKNIDSQDKFRDLHNIDYNYLFKHGEKIGLGTTSYELIQVDEIPYFK